MIITDKDEWFLQYLRGARKIKSWMDQGFLCHSILCNFSVHPPVNNFCNCGLTDILRSFDKVQDLMPKGADNDVPAKAS